MNTVHPTTYQQTVASNTWTINHGLACYPTVSVKVMYNGNLTEIIPQDISYPSTSQVVVTFSQAFTGEVRLA